MKKNLYLFAISVLTTACSTVPVSAPKLTGPAVVFTRDAGFIGNGCTFNAIVDDETVGLLNAGKIVQKRVENGKHKVAIDNDTAMCPNVRMTKVVEVTGDPIVLRIGITSNFQVIFDQTE